MCKETESYLPGERVDKKYLVAKAFPGHISEKAQDKVQERTKVCNETESYLPPW